MRSNPFRGDLEQYSNGIGFRLVNPTDDIRVITQSVFFLLGENNKPTIRYHKSGVLLADLVDKQYRQQDLFHQPKDASLAHSEKLMELMDSINSKYGARTVRLATEGFFAGVKEIGT